MGGGSLLEGTEGIFSGGFLGVFFSFPSCLFGVVCGDIINTVFADCVCLG